MDPLAERLRELRTALGWSQADVASRSGLSQKRVSDLERGSTWHMEHARAVAAAFGMSLAEFVDPQGEPSSDLSPEEHLLIQTLRHLGPRKAADLLLDEMDRRLREASRPPSRP